MYFYRSEYQYTKPASLLFSNRRKETLTIRQTLDNLRLDLSVDDDDEDDNNHLLQQQTNVTKV